jgi:hypothetical protein
MVSGTEQTTRWSMLGSPGPGCDPQVPPGCPAHRNFGRKRDLTATASGGERAPETPLGHVSARRSSVDRALGRKIASVTRSAGMRHVLFERLLSVLNDPHNAGVSLVFRRTAGSPAMT